jgi:hypothetical protein
MVDLIDEDWKKTRDQHVLCVSFQELCRVSTDNSIFCQNVFWWRNKNAGQICVKIEDPQELLMV